MPRVLLLLLVLVALVGPAPAAVVRSTAAEAELVGPQHWISKASRKKGKKSSSGQHHHHGALLLEARPAA